MNDRKAGLEKAFIEGKLEQLTKLRDDLLRMTQGKQDEEADINRDSSDDARGNEDDAQRLTMLELDGNLVARNVQRLARVERALQKVHDGTYGFSDASGEPIPVERLNASPDAIYTVAEQSALDKQP